MKVIPVTSLPGTSLQPIRLISSSTISQARVASPQPLVGFTYPRLLGKSAKWDLRDWVTRWAR
jgi:hypothetical protein